jgi:hypothetical protein
MCVWHQVAMVFVDMGRVSQASTIMQQALKLREAVHGVDAPETNMCRANLAEVPNPNLSHIYHT